MIDATTHYVVIEVDEDQHKTYACECEQMRMVGISQALGTATVFLRYNPDGFTDAGGQKQKIGGTQRRATLLDWIGFCVRNPPTNFCEAMYLFYDGHDPLAPMQRMPILEFENSEDAENSKKRKRDDDLTAPVNARDYVEDAKQREL